MMAADNILFTGSWLLAGPELAPRRGWAIRTSKGIITDIGQADLLLKNHIGTVRHFPDSILMPGLVNAHTHLELTRFPAWKLRFGTDYHPHDFVDWILQIIKTKRNLTPDDYSASINEGIRISLESGTTAIGDI